MSALLNQDYHTIPSTPPHSAGRPQGPLLRDGPAEPEVLWPAAAAPGGDGRGGHWQDSQVATVSNIIETMSKTKVFFKRLKHALHTEKGAFH